MRILITNDDGILAPGLAVLEDLANELAGPDGEVWVVAPQTEQSGVGHCISYTKPVLMHTYGPRRFAVEGSPADCILVGLNHIMDTPPDLVLSGVNKGNNAAENTLYSGTIGAVMEAALANIPAVALSQFFGPHNASLDDQFEAARASGVAAIKACLTAGFPKEHDYKLFYNINFPPVAGADVKGIKAVSQGYRRDGAFTVTPTDAPNGRRFLFVHGHPQQTPTAPGTDAHANLDGYTAVTPMRCDLTARGDMARLEDALPHDA